MATPALLSIEQYLRTPFRPDLDFIAGDLQERSVGEYEHSRMQWLIGAFFASHEQQWSLRGVTEQRIRVSATDVRMCDLALLRADAPRERVVSTPPLICIEILSPGDRLARAKEVLADYLRMGVENIWLIDPIYRSAWTFDATGLHEADPARLTVSGTPILLDLTEPFAALD